MGDSVNSKFTILSIITGILILSISFPAENAFAITETKITASDGTADVLFGNSVSISGDTAIVGAPGTGGGVLSGSAYIFEFDGASWIQKAKLTASDGKSNDSFGFSVSISGDTAIVSATGDDDDGIFSGSAYIFEFDGANWIQKAKLTASDGAAFDSFGRSVSISGDTAIVSNFPTGSLAGDAYIFEKPNPGWTDSTETAKLAASDIENGDRFGISVSISGDTAIVGASGDDDLGFASGSVYIFEKNGVWPATETSKN